MRIHKSERNYFGDYTIQACGWSFIPEEAMTIGDVSNIEEMAEQCWIKVIEPKIMLAKLEGYDISVDDIAISVSEEWQYGTQHKFEIMCEAHSEEMKCIKIIEQCIAEAEQDILAVFEDVFNIGYDCVIECGSEEEAAYV